MEPEAAILVHNYLHFSFVVAFVYDCFLTFPDEVERVWKRLRIRASRWYLINRYFTLAGFVLVSALQFITLSPQGCSHFSILRQALIVLNVLVIAVVFSLRTYALYDRSKLILAVIVVPSMGLLGTACWALGTQTHPTAYPSSLPGCHTSISEAQAAHIAVAWKCLVGFDALLFILTVARTVRLSPNSGRLRSIGCSSLFRSTTYLNLVGIVYRDGAIYFAVMGLFNLANVITFYAAPDLLRGALSTPNSAISALLCARLMLNIHEAPTIDGARPVPSGSHDDARGNGAPTAGVAFTSQFELGAMTADSYNTTTEFSAEYTMEKLSPTSETLLPGRSQKSSLGWLPTLTRTKSTPGVGEEYELEDMNDPSLEQKSAPVSIVQNA